MLDLKPGDIVRMNDQYRVLLKDRGKLWKVTSYPWKVSGTPVVKLEGRTSGYAVDGLDLICSCSDVENLHEKYKARIESDPDLRNEEERIKALIRFNNPDTSADGVASFLELVRQNPDLPIVPIVDNDAVCGEYDTAVYAFNGAEVKTFVFYDNKLYFWDDRDKLALVYLDSAGDDYLDCYPEFSESEIVVLAHEWAESLPWKKAILVWIG